MGLFSTSRSSSSTNNNTHNQQETLTDTASLDVSDNGVGFRTGAKTQIGGHVIISDPNSIAAGKELALAGLETGVRTTGGALEFADRQNAGARQLATDALQFADVGAGRAFAYGEQAQRDSFAATDRDRIRTADLLTDALQANDAAAGRAFAYGEQAQRDSFAATDRDRIRTASLLEGALSYGNAAIRGATNLIGELFTSTDRDRQRALEYGDVASQRALEFANTAATRSFSEGQRALEYGNVASQRSLEYGDVANQRSLEFADRAAARSTNAGDRAYDLVGQALEANNIFSSNVASGAFQTIEQAQQATANTLENFSRTTSAALDNAAAAEQSDSTELGKTMLMAGAAALTAYLIFR